MTDSLVVELLDYDLRHSIQSWSFDSISNCQIGRSTTADVVIRNPYVSRTHASVVKSSTGWILSSVSNQGIIVDGQSVRSAEFSDEIEFLLTRKGPLIRLKFTSSDLYEDYDCNATIGEEDFNLPMLMLDEKQRDEDVAEIEHLEFFGKLQEIANNLKNNS